MRPLSALGLLITCALMTGCVASPGAPETPPSGFTVAAEGEGNEMLASTQGDAVVFDVHSRGGIGSATVEFAPGATMKNIVFRLHLRGLEQFRLSYEATTVVASVSSSFHREVVQSVISPAGSEQPILPNSPFWMEIGERSGQPTAGYFEIKMPKDFMQKGYRSFSIRWVDFFR